MTIIGALLRSCPNHVPTLPQAYPVPQPCLNLAPSALSHSGNTLAPHPPLRRRRIPNCYTTKMVIKGQGVPVEIFLEKVLYDEMV